MKNTRYQTLYIINIFAHMNYLNKLAEKNSQRTMRIKIINLFCICNLEKYRTTLIENCLEKREVFNFERLYPKYLKTIRKLIKKRNKVNKSNKI